MLSGETRGLRTSLSGHCSWCHLVFKELGPQQLSRMARSRGGRSQVRAPCTQPGVPLEGSQSHRAFFSPLLHTSPASFLCIMTDARP